MDSSEEKYTSAQPPRLPSGENATPSSQPLSPSLQRAMQAQYIDPHTAPSPFAPPPAGAGDDAPTLRAKPSPAWPGQACRYCGWRPVEAGSTCPQCHQPVPIVPESAARWRPIAIGASGLTGVLAIVLLFTLLHHPQTTNLSDKAQRTAITSATSTNDPQGNGTPTFATTATPTGPGIIAGGGGPGTSVSVTATPTHMPGTPLPTSTPAPTNTPAPGCAWQSRASSGTYYIYWPGDATYGPGHYGYVISATIYYDGCGNAYARSDVTSDDTGSPPSIVTAVLYRTANCTGSDKVLSQQHAVALVAGAHSVGTSSATSPGQHCVYAATKVGLGAAGDGNSQFVTSVIITAG